MGLLFRLLIVSLLIVFAGVVCWPIIEDRFVAPISVAEESDSGNSLVPSEKQISTKTQQFQIKAAPAVVVSNHKSDAIIYRWRDDSGRVVFSDRPMSISAVAYTPVEINHISATGVRRPQGGMALNSSPLVAREAVVSVATEDCPNFKFSNISAGQKHGYILLSGRVSRGCRCKRLRVTAAATNDRGGFVRDHDTLSYRGSGSTLYEMKIRSRWKGDGRRPQWNPAEVSAVCLD